MHRRALVILTLVLLATVALGACGNKSEPALSDPREIVTKAVEAMQKAKTVHMGATVDGTLKPTLLGLGDQLGDVSLAGTTLALDADLANKNLKMTLGVPALLGMTADVIVVGPDTFTKVSLTGNKYVKSATSTTTPTDPTVAIAGLQALLARPDVTATKKDDASCGSKTCYAIQVDLKGDALAALIPGTNLGDATVGLTILVEKDTLLPAAINGTAKGSTVGDLTLKLTLSDWDKAVTVTAPPADQVQ